MDEPGADPDRSGAAGRAETEARASDDALLGVLDRAPSPIVVLDREGGVRYANAAFTALGNGGVGVGLAVALPDLADQLAPLVAVAFDEGRGVDRRVVRPIPVPGRRRGYWQVSMFPVDRPDGSRMGVAVFLADVSDERRVARRLTDSVARLDLTLSAGGLATWDWDLLRNEAGWGAAAADVIGIDLEGFDRRPESFLAAIHPDDRDDHRRRIVAAAKAGADFHNEVRVAHADGEVQWLEVRGRVVTAADGTPRRMIGVVADITERSLVEGIKTRLLEREHKARLEAERARERLALLAEVGASLMSSLDSGWVLQSLPRLLVPRIGDWCAVDIVGESGDIEQVSIVHAEPGGEADVRAMRRWRNQAGGDGLWSVRRTMRTGAAELVVEVSDADLARVAVDDDHLDLLLRLAPRSAITVPLMAQGRMMGGITVVATHERRFEPDDLTLMENIAGRVAMAIENARLFESRIQVARALQQTLLPPALPDIAGADIAARYRVAADGIDIGGDFYDLFPMDDTTWAVVIGDVCGKGAGAAAVTGLFRHTVRAVAMGDRSPAEVLRSTNDAILGRIDDTRFCTAVFVALRAAPSGLDVRVACGGHPRPVVVRADGTVERVDVSGTLLGILPDPILDDVALRLEPGDAIVLYTDGVTEARRGHEQFGDGRLVDALALMAAAGDVTADGLAEGLEAAITDFQNGGAGDDVAVVVIRAR